MNAAIEAAKAGEAGKGFTVVAASTQNMASTRQVERAAQDLNELAGRLKALVAATGDQRGTG